MSAADLHSLKSLRCMSLFGLRHLSLLGRKNPPHGVRQQKMNFMAKIQTQNARESYKQKLCWFHMAQRFSRAKRRQTKTCLQENFRKLRRDFVAFLRTF